ncbi:hypothetical protein K491DRAFT_693533 [Lophiostoma macrostomum CBS 122681]|uniref:Uncharacterized protein n=1 Tax=Lophiostoma macrostomum CBS 122681 TaxID=1314788 RepID=A0A6A6T837_9PLEO|nr:hypothetical protein K491DRAFT_693533 [Lophiostoma macrostomum CBS 122681]
MKKLVGKITAIVIGLFGLAVAVSRIGSHSDSASILLRVLEGLQSNLPQLRVRLMR